MRGWIIYSESTNILNDERYEIDRFIEAAKEDGVQLEIYAPKQFDLMVTEDNDKSILIDGEYIGLPDFVMSRMGAGTTYFALAVLRHLERLGVYSVNSSASIEMVKDKLYAQQILARNNLQTPNTMLVKFPVDVDRVEENLGFPVVVKTVSGTQGSGVILSKSKEGFDDLMQMIEATNKDANIILQEFAKDSHGRDLRVFTIGGRAVCCYKRQTKDGAFKANFSAGAGVEPYEMTPEIEWLASQVAHVLALDVAGIDLLFNGDHYLVCEANSSPAFKGLESCMDKNMALEVLRFIRVRLGIFSDE